MTAHRWPEYPPLLDEATSSAVAVALLGVATQALRHAGAAAVADLADAALSDAAIEALRRWETPLLLSTAEAVLAVVSPAMRPKVEQAIARARLLYEAEELRWQAAERR